jgi:hypothetical protein
MILNSIRETIQLILHRILIFTILIVGVVVVWVSGLLYCYLFHNFSFLFIFLSFTVYVCL